MSAKTPTTAFKPESNLMLNENEKPKDFNSILESDFFVELKEE